MVGFSEELEVHCAEVFGEGTYFEEVGGSSWFPGSMVLQNSGGHDAVQVEVIEEFLIPG